MLERPITKEAMKQCTKLIQKNKAKRLRACKVGREITKWGAIEKILLSQNIRKIINLIEQQKLYRTLGHQ